MSIISSEDLRKNFIPFVIGATVGFFGHYVVRWLRGNDTTSVSQTTFHILDLSKNILNVNKVSYSEFNKQITYKELDELRESVGWPARKEITWCNLFEKSTEIVCVRKERKLVGFGLFIGNDRMGSIFSIHVHPEFQKQKIGTLIMNHLVRQLKDKDYGHIGLFGSEKNKTVMDFYKKFGFKPNPYGMESSREELKEVSTSFIINHSQSI